ncbi:hypothetical protein ACJ73_09090 [Blastomyces percursus]|uniref:Uncharacterized protein n=1 Tax=Blastomyces percursus TaxID=1658174 RepID=A0A1J9QEH7_9EURO|nr:hypothetical protein ACJ73_09090 [Blastomyces percursus]
MDGPLFVINAQINDKGNADALIDAVRKLHLERVSIKPREFLPFNDGPSTKVINVVRFTLDIGGIKEDTFYETNLGDRDLIVGTPWLKRNDVLIDATGPALIQKGTNLYVASLSITNG